MTFESICNIVTKLRSVRALRVPVGVETDSLRRRKLRNGEGNGRLHAGRNGATLRGAPVSENSVPPSLWTGGLFHVSSLPMSEPSTVPPGPAGASMPPTVVMQAGRDAWRHHCGYVHVGRFDVGDVCDGCLHDVDPADVEHFKLVTMDNTVLAGPVAAERDAKARVRQAAFRAAHVLPGPVGEAISRELFAWEEFGFRLGSGGLMSRLIEDIEQRPMPVPKSKTADAS
jgi:hypothetical protein